MFEASDDALGKTCMPAIDESIQLAAAPANEDDDLRIERPEDAAQRSNGQSFKSATLESGNDVMTDSDAVGHVDLADAESMAQSAGRPADLEIIHRGR